MSVRTSVKGAAAVVAVSTFVLLYFGLVDLARLSGMHDMRAWLYPLAIDGMTFAAYAATLALSGSGLAFAWFVVAVGSGMSLVGQWLHASALSEWVWAGPIAAAPALSLALVWHLLFLVVRPKPQPVAESVATEFELYDTPEPEPVAVSVAPAVASNVAAVAPVAATVCLSDSAPVVRDTERLSEAVALLQAAQAEGRKLTGAAMAVALKLPNAHTESGKRSGQRWVTRARAALS